MYFLNSINQLYSYHQNTLRAEPSPAQVEEVLQVGPQEVQHHGVVPSTLAIVVNLRQGRVLAKPLVELVLEKQL